VKAFFISSYSRFYAACHAVIFFFLILLFEGNIVKTTRLISERIAEAGGRTLLVGECVRDRFFGRPSTSMDIQVHDLGCEQVCKALEDLNPKFTGEDTGLVARVLVDDRDFYVFIPTDESESFSQRDFTINTLEILLDEGLKPLDEFDAMKDIRHETLRAVSDKFVEDPVGALRGMSYAGRYRLTMEPNTIAMCEKMASDFGAIPKDQIWHEFYSLMSKGVNLRKGLSILKDTAWLKLFPELSAMDSCKQDLEKYREENVWEHALHVCDAALDIAIREQLPESERLVLLFSALLCNVGKPKTTFSNGKGRWASFGQGREGVPLAEQFLNSIGSPSLLTEKVLSLVGEPFVHESMPVPNEKIVRRLSDRLSSVTVREWACLVEAVNSCMLPRSTNNRIHDYVEIADRLAYKDSRPKRILTGRHLIDDFGMSEGVEVGEVLKEAYQEQLNVFNK